MQNLKTKLLDYWLNRYTKEEMKHNPFGCVEAIGYLRVCKIVMPELEQEINKLINLYLKLAEIYAKKDC